MTRSELYALVWQQPMTKLSEELGLPGSGLAKICTKHAIPTPARGYWAKLKAGKKVQIEPLGPLPEGILDTIRISETIRRREKGRKDVAASNAVTLAAGVVQIPPTLRGLHPVVAEWLEAHRKEQARLRAEKRSRSRGFWWSETIPADLTERDRYRFRVTSALLEAFEAVGGRVNSGTVQGKLALEVGGETSELAVAERMRRFRGKPSDNPTGWTAFPHHHNFALAPTGFLRFTITTYYGEGRRKEWVETDKALADTLLPSLVEGLVAVGPALAELHREREEWHRQYEAARRIREEQLRLAQLEEQRWQKFRRLASDWHESQQLRAFLAALEASQAALRDEVDDMPSYEWVHWARRRINDLDPFNTLVREAI